MEAEPQQFKKIGDYFAHLVDNPDAAVAHWKNPRRAVERAGLPDKKAEIVLSGDLKKIRAAIRREYPGREVLFGVVRPEPSPPGVVRAKPGVVRPKPGGKPGVVRPKPGGKPGTGPKRPKPKR